MSKNSALASLGSYSDNFTDSEDEEDRKSVDGSPASSESQVQIPAQISKESTPEPPSSAQKKALRLVSYNDNLISDDEDNHPHPAPPDSPELNKKVDKASEYGFSLPPEPKGKCAPELQEKISHLYEKMKNTNMDMNKIIQERKEFRNPSIYEKLIQFCNINEQGTNYPPDLYDPLQWGNESFYEELARQQKVEMDRIEKEKKDKAKTVLVLAAAAKVEEEAKKRKSKWDQPAPNMSVQSNIKSIPPAAVQNVALTTNITGTKGTVIQAFGSLPKKPKI